MKKFLPAILLIFCVGLVIFGVVSITRDSESRAETTSRRVNTEASQTDSKGNIVHKSAVPGEDMLEVGMPADVPSRFKEYTGFVLSFNPENRTPNWVAWELLGSEVDGKEPRYKTFWQDTDLDNCPTPADYKNSGFDRGHMCPAADQKWSPEAMRDCFSLANIVPQNNSLNTGAWSTLENKERAWAKRDSAILIVCGPIYKNEDRQRIGDSGVRVPSAFFKVLAAPFAEDPRGIAFIYPNMSSPGNMQNYVVTIRDVEKETGYDFFHKLPQDLQDKMETVSSFRDWNRK